MKSGLCIFVGLDEQAMEEPPSLALTTCPSDLPRFCLVITSRKLDCATFGCCDECNPPTVVDCYPSAPRGIILKCFCIDNNIN